MMRTWGDVRMRNKPLKARGPARLLYTSCAYPLLSAHRKVYHSDYQECRREHEMRCECRHHLKKGKQRLCTTAPVMLCWCPVGCPGLSKVAPFPLGELTEGGSPEVWQHAGAKGRAECTRHSPRPALAWRAARKSALMLRKRTLSRPRLRPQSLPPRRTHWLPGSAPTAHFTSDSVRQVSAYT